MLFEELQAKIEDWAYDKNLLHADNVERQFLKVIEEVGELASGIAKNDRDETIDAIGDVFVTLIILSAQLELDPVYCLNEAYQVIAKRTGKTIDGVFIKDS